MKTSKLPGYKFVKKTVKGARFLRLAQKMQIDPLDNYLIFSDPRGGSTWLTEIIKEGVSQPILWEPLHLGFMKQFENIGFGWRQYIPEEVQWNEAKQQFDRLFSGKILNTWLTQMTNIQELLGAEAFIVKFCRGHMLLPYLVHNYTFKHAPIHLIRHPFAVVSSQLKHGAWNYDFTKYTIPDIPYNEVYKEHEEYLGSLKTHEEALTASWCIANKVPLSHTGNNTKWITLSYEELLLDPEKSVQRIFDRWNIDCDIKALNLTKRSVTTKAGSPISAKEQLGYWKKNLKDDQIGRMKAVLNYFEITAYNDSVEPLITYNDLH